MGSFDRQGRSQKSAVSPRELLSGASTGASGSPALFAPIAIDLGAKHTGCFFPGIIGPPNQTDPAEGSRGLVVEVDQNAFTLMMTERRARRHQRRAYKRRRLAKRLVCLWLEPQFVKLESEDRIRCERFLRGLMNRRGFTYLSLDERIRGDELERALPMLEAAHLLGNHPTVAAWLTEAASDPKVAEQVLQHELFRTVEVNRRSKKRLSAALQKMLDASGQTQDGDIIKAARESLLKVLDYLTAVAQAPQTGHKHRSEYFRDIESDVTHTAEGRYVSNLLGLTPKSLSNLVGHISNWDLRALRSYFHDPSRKCLEKLDPVRFHRAWLQFFRRWSLAGERPERRQDFAEKRRRWVQRLQEIPKGERGELWKLLTETDPNETIPPFESQGNRRPPRCQSLLLCPDSLDKHYPPQAEGQPPQWRVWAQRLAQHNPSLLEDLESIARADARCLGRVPMPARGAKWHELSASDQQVLLEETQKRWYDARLLQRVLERHQELDPYRLRSIVSRTAASNQADALATLTRHIGDHQVDAFLEFACCFYDETRKARRGIWLPGNAKLLRVCNAHPPHKRKIEDLLVAQIITRSSAPPPRLGQTVRDAVGNTSVQPPPELQGARTRSLRTLLNRMADGVKQYSGDLKYWYRAALAKKQAEQPKPLDPPEQEAFELYAWAQAAARQLAGRLGLSESAIEHFDNPYSLAQLHQILFAGVSGFASTCKACTHENFWRSVVDSQGRANAARLPAHSIRPIDGAVAKALEAKARQVAREFANALSNEEIPPGVLLHVPILLEENRFKFRQELAEIKGIGQGKKGKQPAQQAAQNVATHEPWKGKYERIREDGGGLCPYCGGVVGEDGEFDHIVAQAVTTDYEGYGFDSEANLIYAHSSCNQSKGKNLYSLENLADAWLREQFQTTDRNEIEEEVRKLVEPWLEERLNRRAFDQLEKPLQRAIRHALFVDHLRGHVLQRLAMQNVARVNGTQRWFGQILIDRISALLKKNGRVDLNGVNFSLHRVPAYEVKALRDNLAKVEPRLKKPGEQGPYSHVIDAALCYAVATTQPQVRQLLGLSSIEHLAEFISPARALALLPDQVRIARVQRRPIYEKKHPWHRPLFKANPLGERFVPLNVTRDGGLFPGFSAQADKPEHSTVNHPKQQKAASNLLRLLWPVLANPPGEVDPSSPNLLEQIAELARRNPEGVIRLHVDKTKAFRHWQECRHKPDDQLARILDALAYRVQRQNLEEIFFGEQGSVSPDKILAKEYFSFEVKLPGLPKTTVTLPCRRAWEALLRDPDLEPHLRSGKKLVKKSNAGELPENAVAIDWDAVVARHFQRPAATRRHRRVRQVFALPRLADASGGFRVERRGFEGSVFQLLQVEEGAYAGFTADAKKPHGFNPSRPVLLPVLARSKSLTPIERTQGASAVVRFNEPKLFESDLLRENGIERLEVLPGTRPRRQVRMRIRREKLQVLMGKEVDAFSLEHSTLLIGKDHKRQLAKLLQEATKISALAPRKDQVEVDGWDRDCIELSWTAGTGAQKKGDANSQQ